MCELITKLQGYLEINGSRSEICRVYLRHIEHLYYKVCVVIGFKVFINFVIKTNNIFVVCDGLILKCHVDRMMHNWLSYQNKHC